jgi:hypothetical protein
VDGKRDVFVGAKQDMTKYIMEALLARVQNNHQLFHGVYQAILM